jgi:hypothetical protein
MTHSIFPLHKAWFDVSSFVTIVVDEYSGGFQSSKLCGQGDIPRGMGGTFELHENLA